MSSLLNKLYVGAAAAAACVILIATAVALYQGIPSALSSVMLGRPPDTPFGAFGLVMLGWIGGFIVGLRRDSHGHGAMTFRHVSATAIFAAVFVILNRHTLGPNFVTESGLALLVALLIWLFVVIAPWTSGPSEE